MVFTVFEFMLQNGTTHILYLFRRGLPLPGDTNLTSLKPGVQWAQILKPRLRTTPLPDDVYTVDMRLNNDRIPDAETTYWCRVVKLPEMATKQHVVRVRTSNQ